MVHYSEESQDEKESKAALQQSSCCAVSRCCGRDLLRVLHSVDQQDAAAKSAATLQRLLHRDRDSSVINLVHIDLYQQQQQLTHFTTISPRQPK